MTDTLHSPEQLRVKFNIAAEQRSLPKPLIKRAVTVLNATNTLEANISVSNAQIARNMEPSRVNTTQPEAVVNTDESEQTLETIRESITAARNKQLQEIK